MNYIIGIDSGGTSTEAVAYDKNGTALKTVRTGFGNPLIDKEKAVCHLEEAVETIFQELTQEKCTHIVFGIAGLDSGNFKTEFEGHFMKYHLPVTFINDAWLAYFASIQNNDGILVISGTGSIAIGMRDGKKYRSGGWGNLLGDEGSAYAISHQMIKNLLTGYDTGNSSYSFLNNQLLDHLKADSVFDVVQYVYQHKKDDIAALAKIVVEAAEQHDDEAIEILKNAGQQLAQLANQLMKQMSAQGHLKIAVSGSVLKKNLFVFNQFSTELKKSSLMIEFVQRKESNTIGAFYYVQALEKGE